MQKYEEIKIKQIREVDPFVSFLYKVQNDDKVKNLLVKETTAKVNGSAILIEKSNLSLNNQLPYKDVKLQKQVSSEEDVRPVPPGIYALPGWVKGRKNISWNFADVTLPDFIHCGPIGALPPNVQECRLIDDILFCLVGIDGDYIYSKKVEKEKVFLVDDTANIALKLLIQNMMPLFSHYSTIIDFVERNIHYERGLVNHALAAAMRKCFGGSVLSVLHENTASLTGSSNSREICHSLTRAASLPYFEILEKWIYKGIISDYYSEFLVEDNELIKKEDLPTEYSDAYWEKRYTIRSQIPIFLSKTADMILRTGKYLNVIRQCGKPVNCPEAKAIVYTMRESQYVEYIKPAYDFASKKLLAVLMDDADLKRRLLSVKHYFLLDQGDFIVQFMDMAEEELQKDIDDIMPSRLESLLELALRTSVVNEDKYKDDVRVELLPYDLLTQMFKILQIPTDMQNEYRNTETMMLTGLEAFVFDYEVKWPLSLVINGKALAYYQILFRHLFYCKHIERLLGHVWSLNKRTKSFPRSEICHYASAFALRQRMFNFIQNLDYYLTLEVIEPHWNDFFGKISQVCNSCILVTNVDEVLFCHNDFLEKCVGDCMLTNPRLFQVLATLMTLCADFSIFLQGIMKCSIDMETSVMGDSMLFSIQEQPFSDMANCPAALENFQLQIASFEKKFDESIICMLHILHSVHQSKQTSKIINMLYRLDFSRFYEEISLKKMENEDDN
ncbi:gamma-tubulin complex component 2 [Caerostris extrusa]|uniref:Gamma-tubulin complex component n=1 Tax=Caerostris extrusa TaxID=172846 RepID=A0AAV4S7U1_CAEEX|nr:gamma-tubulin complex component 2 [Caerostris extrusa]